MCVLPGAVLGWPVSAVLGDGWQSTWDESGLAEHWQLLIATDNTPMSQTEPPLLVVLLPRCACMGCAAHIVIGTLTAIGHTRVKVYAEVAASAAAPHQVEHVHTRTHARACTR